MEFEDSEGTMSSSSSENQTNNNMRIMTMEEVYTTIDPVKRQCKICFSKPGQPIVILKTTNGCTTGLRSHALTQHSIQIPLAKKSGPRKRKFDTGNFL